MQTKGASASASVPASPPDLGRHPAGHDARAYPGLEVKPGPGPGTPRAMMQCSAGEYREISLNVVAGKLPPDLYGHVYVAGPRVHSGTQALASSGILYRVDFNQGSARLTSRVMSSASGHGHRAVNELGYFQRTRFEHLAHSFRSITYGQTSLTLGMVCAPNTAPIAMPNGLLFVTTDAGRPYIIDPRTLETISPLGKSEEWKPALAFPWAFQLLQTTAHPAVDPVSGELFMTNHAPRAPLVTPFVHLVHWNKIDERLHSWRLLDAETGAPLDAQTIHQIAVTRDYVILLNSDFKVNFVSAAVQLLSPWLGPLAGPIQKLAVRPSNPNAVFWVVRRADLLNRSRTLTSDKPPAVTAFRFECGPGALHFAVDYENPENIIRMVVAHTPTEDLTHTIKAGEMLMNGRRASPSEDGMVTAVPGVISAMGIHRIDMSTRLVDSRLHADERYTWGLTVYNNSGNFQGELSGQKWVYLNSDGFTADLLPRRIYELYRDRIGSTRNLPIADGRPASFFRFHVETGDFEGWRLPPGWYSFAPTFIPSSAPGTPKDGNKDPEGYLMGFVISDPTPDLPAGSSGDEIWIFDAQDIPRGPICRLSTADLNVGMSLHSFWVPEFPVAQTDYHVDLRKDLDMDDIEARYLNWLHDITGLPEWACLPYRAFIRLAIDFKEMRRMFEEQIYPHFPNKKVSVSHPAEPDPQRMKPG